MPLHVNILLSVLLIVSTVFTLSEINGAKAKQFSNQIQATAIKGHSSPS